MKALKLLAIALCLSATACAPLPPMQKPAMTPLETQSIQSRDYEHDKNVVFPSVMSVFQDLGYTVTSADRDTGFISANRASSSQSKKYNNFGVFLIEMAKDSKVKNKALTTSQTKATAFVEKIGSITKVRLNFVNTSKKSYANGQFDQQDTLANI